MDQATVTSRRPGPESKSRPRGAGRAAGGGWVASGGAHPSGVVVVSEHGGARVLQGTEDREVPRVGRKPKSALVT
jgi:hypothetical protein